jgi:hypothetical protein
MLILRMRHTGWRIIIKRVLVNFTVICFCFLLFGFGGAKISGQREVGAGPSNIPQVIYVTDFDLEVQDVQSGPGILHPRGSRANILPKPRAAQKDPATQARELVDLMSASLVKEFTKLGFDTQRLHTADAHPTQGLLIRGVFTQVDEGNRLRRAVIGFGAGGTDLQVAITADDLAQGLPKPFYELDTSAESRKMPGAIITMNPYVAAGKFLISGKDLNKNVKATASKIATAIAERIRKQDNKTLE